MCPPPPSTTAARPRKTRLVTQAIVGSRSMTRILRLQFMPQALRATWPRCSRAPRPTRRTTTTCPPTTWWSSRHRRRGPTIKRFRPVRPGRAFPIHKPMTHVTIVVESTGGLEHGTQGPSQRLSAGRLAHLERQVVRRQDYTDLLKEDMPIRKLVTSGSPTPASAWSRSSAASTRYRDHPHRQAGHRHRQGRRQGGGAAPAIGKLTNPQGQAEIKEIRQPELDAVLVAANIAQQLERRIAFRKAIKQAVQRHDEGGRQGREDRRRRPSRRCRDGPPRVGRRAASRSTRCAPTSTTARSTPTPPTGASASRSGSTAATSVPERRGAARGAASLTGRRRRLTMLMPRARQASQAAARPHEWPGPRAARPSPSATTR